MPVTEPASKRDRIKFEMSSTMQYPLQYLHAGENMEIVRFWRSKENFWLRIEHPYTHESFDYRIVKVYRNLDATHVAVSPARRWNVKRSLATATVLEVINPVVLQTLSTEDVETFSQSMRFEESFQIITNDRDYTSVFEDQVLRTFGFCSDWDKDMDIESLALSRQMVIGETLTLPEQEVEIDLDTTISEPGFLKLKLFGDDETFKIVSFFVVKGRSYLGVRKPAEQSDGIKSPLILIELKSKHLVRILPEDEFLLAARDFLDACENEGPARNRT